MAIQGISLSPPNLEACNQIKPIQLYDTRPENIYMKAIRQFECMVNQKIMDAYCWSIVSDYLDSDKLRVCILPPDIYHHVDFRKPFDVFSKIMDSSEFSSVPYSGNLNAEMNRFVRCFDGWRFHYKYEICARSYAIRNSCYPNQDLFRSCICASVYDPNLQKLFKTYASTLQSKECKSMVSIFKNTYHKMLQQEGESLLLHHLDRFIVQLKYCKNPDFKNFLNRYPKIGLEILDLTSQLHIEQKPFSYQWKRIFYNQMKSMLLKNPNSPLNYAVLKKFTRFLSPLDLFEFVHQCHETIPCFEQCDRGYELFKKSTMRLLGSLLGKRLIDEFTEMVETVANMKRGQLKQVAESCIIDSIQEYPSEIVYDLETLIFATHAAAVHPGISIEKRHQLVKWIWKEYKFERKVQIAFSSIHKNLLTNEGVCCTIS